MSVLRVTTVRVAALCPHPAQWALTFLRLVERMQRTACSALMVMLHYNSAGKAQDRTAKKVTQWSCKRGHRHSLFLHFYFLVQTFFFSACDWSTGLFQDQKGQRECKTCPPGFHCLSSTQKSNVSSTPLICPEGYYCPNKTLLGRPVPCPRGTYSNTRGLTSAGNELFKVILYIYIFAFDIAYIS